MRDGMKKFIRSICILLLFAVLAANNFHLPAMQVVAWTGMLITYNREAELSQAVAMTFDGEHPCEMCKAIKAEQTSADTDNLVAGSAVRLLLFIESVPSWVQVIFLMDTLFRQPASLTLVAHQPETPPPRSLLIQFVSV
jgi:hypothetical protein